MSYLSLTPLRAVARPRRARIVAPYTTALLLLASACGEPATAPRNGPAEPSDAISSGAIGVSPRQLFFLLRDLEPTAFQGSFDASLSPEVIVCLWVDDACRSRALGPVTLGTRGTTSLTVNARRERYVFRWRTKGASLQPDAVYRLMVRVNGMQLGYLDIATGRKQRDLRDVDRREFVPLRVGAPLKLAFRIEEGPAIPRGIPGRYESDPDVCPSGCLVHATPSSYFSVVWGGIRLGDLGGYGEALVGFTGTYDNPSPVIPPVPASGSVEIPVTGSWSWRYDEMGDVEIWVDGMEWGHWAGADGGAILVPLYSPWSRLSPLGKVSSYAPTP